MSYSLARWVAAIAFAVGAVLPATAPAQTKLRFSDTQAYSGASYYDQTEGDVDEPSPSDMNTPMKSPAGTSYGCDSCCESVCDTCCPPQNWFSADYLTWWTKGNNLPALVTTSPAGIAQAAAGVLDLPTTTVLFGRGEIDEGDRPGMRFTLGHWSDAEGTVGLQATYFGVFDDNDSGDFFGRTAAAIGGGTGAPILARPFFNVDPLNTGPDSRLISFPGVVDGATAINSSSEMHSVSLLLRQHMRSGNRGRVDLVGGYRYFKLREGILIREGLVTTDPFGVFPIGTTFAFEDRFLAENNFHGGDMGFVAEFWDENWSIEILAKCAFGNLNRSSTVSGSSVTDPPPAGGGVATNGALLALPTNIGTRSFNDFAALPELGLNLKYEPRRGITFTSGYTVLFMNDVVRSGELIDTTVNGTQLLGGARVGPARPMSLAANETDFWAHGVNFGVTLSR